MHYATYELRVSQYFATIPVKILREDKRVSDHAHFCLFLSAQSFAVTCSDKEQNNMLYSIYCIYENANVNNSKPNACMHSTHHLELD